MDTTNTQLRITDCLIYSFKYSWSVYSPVTVKHTLFLLTLLITLQTQFHTTPTDLSHILLHILLSLSLSLTSMPQFFRHSDAEVHVLPHTIIITPITSSDTQKQSPCCSDSVLCCIVCGGLFIHTLLQFSALSRKKC